MYFHGQLQISAFHGSFYGFTEISNFDTKEKYFLDVKWTMESEWDSHRSKNYSIKRELGKDWSEASWDYSEERESTFMMM